MTTLLSMQEITSVQSGNVETVQSLANALLEAGYKITLLNLETARNTLSQGANSFNAPTGEEARNAVPYQPIARETATYFKNLAHISAEMQVEIARLVQSHVSDFSKSMVSLLDKASKADSNVGTAMATAAMKSLMATAAASCEGLTETARRVTELAQANASALADSLHSISAPAALSYKKAA